MIKNFFNKLKLILNNKSIMKKIGITFLILFIYKVFSFIPVPLLQVDAITSVINQSSFFDFLDTFSGGALGRFSIMALGISPYITASIVVQILQMDIIPLFKEWGEQGEAGKRKVNKVTRYLAMILAFFNALAIILGLSSSLGNELQLGVDPSVMVYIYMALVVTTGTAIILWLSDNVTRHGVGNGSSMIIAAGILTSVPTAMLKVWNQYITNGTGTKSVILYIVIMLLYVAVILGVTYMQIATRKIPVQYANRQQKTESNIPIKLNSAGVMPVIFASTLMSIPSTIAGFMSASTSSGWGYWVDQICNYSNTIGFIVYIALIYVFSFFYSFLTIDPEKIADNLSKQNAFVPGVRPGEDTHDFVARVLFKVTLIGATYLAILSAIPIITTKIFSLDSSVTIGGTSLLIVVGVAVETLKQIETEAVGTTYKGFSK